MPNIWALHIKLIIMVEYTLATAGFGLKNAFGGFVGVNLLRGFKYLIVEDKNGMPGFNPEEAILIGCRRIIFLTDSKNATDLVFRSGFLIFETAIPIVAHRLGGLQSALGISGAVSDAIDAALDVANTPNGTECKKIIIEHLKLQARANSSLALGQKLLTGVRETWTSTQTKYAPYTDHWAGGGLGGRSIGAKTILPFYDTFSLETDIPKYPGVAIPLLDVIVYEKYRLSIPGITRCATVAWVFLPTLFIVGVRQRIPYLNQLYYAKSLISLVRGYNAHYKFFPILLDFYDDLIDGMRNDSCISFQDENGNIKIESFILALD
jgi:hypothetical protein